MKTGGRRRNPVGDLHLTPQGLYQLLDAEFGFRLDAACDSTNFLAPVGLCRDLGRDGLLERWQPGPVFCNPPYSHYDLWLERALLESQETTIVMLIPADTSTRAWRRIVAEHASEVRFVTGRLRFQKPCGSNYRTVRGGGGMTGPSAVVILRPGHIGPPTYRYIDRPQERLS